MVRIIRGVDKGSRKKIVDMFMFSSVLKLIVVSEIIAIRKAWIVVLIHKWFFLDNSSRGNIISDGIIIFSILVG